MHKLSLLVFASMALLAPIASSATSQAPGNLALRDPIQASPSGHLLAQPADAEIQVSDSGMQVSDSGMQALAFARDWILKTSDNICGLRDANQLTHPAQVNYETCLQATPEMKRLRDQKIDPKSAEGIQLRSAGISRVTNACERVRASQGYCSVWKQISHKDGRAISDLSSLVIAQY
jgi:hypothetical protein